MPLARDLIHTATLHTPAGTTDPYGGDDPATTPSTVRGLFQQVATRPSYEESPSGSWLTRTTFIVAPDADDEPREGCRLTEVKLGARVIDAGPFRVTAVRANYHRKRLHHWTLELEKVGPMVKDRGEGYQGY
jgi:hypothetical protein